ncbi:reverse transcriptase [Phytophthora megakarya]|uniref:Reverse transcriptase n=1 Tax=Phytophthora megakarya TaxID=4795 RepID=A0A225VAC0_9STRA|nr:reverse transcriptase [Phytophthora megakarya]
MPFGLKNAPQIYQRMIDNALYGFTRIPKSEDPGGTLDVFEDIANDWDQLCDRVENLLKACDEWNLSISVVKSFWGMPEEEYLGHMVSHNGLDANPKICLH